MSEPVVRVLWEDPGWLPPFRVAFEAEGVEDDPLIGRYERFLAEQGLEIAGIEFMEAVVGRRVTYDVNTDTNDNAAVEAEAAVPAARLGARFPGALLAEGTRTVPEEHRAR